MAAQLSLSLIAAPDTARLETREVEGYEFTLGRGHDVDWSLLDPDRNILSRRHCMIVQEDGDWWVEDLSGNGTFLNHVSTPIGHGARQRLRDGDRVRMGPYEFQVRLTSAAPATAPFSDTGSDAWDRPVQPPDHDAWPPPAATPRASSPFDDDEPPPLAAAAKARGGNPFLGAESASPPWSDEAHDPARNARPPAPVVTQPPADEWPPRVAPTRAEQRPTRPPEIANPFLSAPDESPDPFPPPPKVEAVIARPIVAPPPFPPVTDANPFAEAGDQAPTPVPSIVRVADPPVGAARLPTEAPAHAAPVVTPAPATPTPPASVAAAPAAATSERLLAALLEGAGLPDAEPRDPEQAMRALGAAFRAMVKGVRDAQRTRRTVRGEFRIAQTSFTQNPLKVAIDDDDALEALLGAGRRGGMTPPKAVEEILLEIVQHELATFAAMQDAVRVLVDSLAPERLRAQAEQAGGLTVLPAQRKARAWDLFEAEHARVAEALRDDFDSVFGKAFARAYERVMSEQGS